MGQIRPRGGVVSRGLIGLPEVLGVALEVIRVMIVSLIGGLLQNGLGIAIPLIMLAPLDTSRCGVELTT